MGYAVAKNIEGPYKKMNNGKPIQKGGHEVMVWESKSGGWYSYVAHGHGKNSGNLRFSKQGIDFESKKNLIYKSPRMELQDFIVQN